MGIIFDLDQTLIDSSIAYEARRNRDWKRVYGLIENFIVYEGIDELIKLLNENNIPICIVTSSPKSYCDRIIKRFGWNKIKMVCYHDTKKHKPNPEPILEGIKKLNCDKNNIISIGDDVKDIIASRAAGVISVLATWGKSDDSNQINSDYICDNVNDLSNLIKDIYNLQ